MSITGTFAISLLLNKAHFYIMPHDWFNCKREVAKSSKSSALFI
jgi:hypothetical protein